ncbi:MAG: RNA polymerase sigma factor [Isosphaeraceae bacterium]|jgi:RNA polymerase sigma-70 factor (ECF subfamily)
MLDASPSVQTPDEILVRRARERDAVAREELFQRYREDAYRVAYRLLGHEQDALDVVQEALIKAYLGLGDFDGRSGFRYWLLRIVGNTALDWGRRRKRRTILRIGNGRSDLPEPAFHDDPARSLHQQDLRRALDKALDHLSPKIRTTFVLFAELGLSYKEIAETQDIPIGTVMSRINAAREKLQQNLDWEKLKGLD